MTAASSRGTLDPPVGRTKAEDGWRWKEAGGLVKTPNWRGRWVEPAGARLPDCTRYPTDMMGTLTSHLFEKEKEIKGTDLLIVGSNSNDFKDIKVRQCATSKTEPFTPAGDDSL